jgi:hypothetical protein
MTPKTIKISGKTFATIAMIISGLATLILGMGNIIPADLHDVLFAFAAFLAALSAYLAHKNQVI